MVLRPQWFRLFDGLVVTNLEHHWLQKSLDRYLEVVEGWKSKNGFSSTNSLLRRKPLNLDSLNSSNEEIIRVFRVSYLSLVNGFLKIFVTKGKRHAIFLIAKAASISVNHKIKVLFSKERLLDHRQCVNCVSYQTLRLLKLYEKMFYLLSKNGVMAFRRDYVEVTNLWGSWQLILTIQ